MIIKELSEILLSEVTYPVLTEIPDRYPGAVLSHRKQEAQ